MIVNSTWMSLANRTAHVMAVMGVVMFYARSVATAVARS